MPDVSNFCLVVVAVVLLIYLLGKRNQDVFSAIGIPGPWTLPLAGGIYTLVRKGLLKFDTHLLKQYGKFAGITTFTGHAIITSDVSFVKQVLVKEWLNFPNHWTFPNNEYGLRTFLTQLENEKWKNVRSHISPTFSTGKLQKMVPLIDRCAKNLSHNLSDIARNGEIFYPKDSFGFFTMDVISSTAFGIDVNSAKDNSNKFVYHAKKLFELNLSNPFILMSMLSPRIASILSYFGVSIIPKETYKYFDDIIRQVKETRLKSGYDNVDFLSLMLKAQITDGTPIGEKEKDDFEGTVMQFEKRPITEEEIFGNAVLFFSAGYETTATTLHYLAYLLAIHPEIQDKVHTEIDDVVGKNDPTYEMMNKLSYLEMCINETLRLYPTAFRTDRKCKKDTVIDGKHIQKDMLILISIISIHMDPEIYPEPERFDPERFTQEAKGKRDQFSFIPFGGGPRVCIGMRLALLEAKIAMTRVLQRYRFLPDVGTEIPIRRFKKMVVLVPENPIRLKLQSRQ